MSHARLSVYVASVLVALVWAMPEARAQAWVGEEGSLDVSFDYNFGKSSKVLGDEDEFPNAGVTTQQFSIGAEYTPIRNLAVTATMPFVLLKYTGGPEFIHPGGGTYDDGDYHSTLTDFRAGARYQLLDEPVALAPHLAFSIPVGDYETIGNAVGGRHLKYLHAGISAGTIIGLATYVHLQYEFSLGEKYDRTAETEKYSQNRSDIGFTIGHKLLDYKLDVSLGANARFGHGGISLDLFRMGGFSMDQFNYHDAILKEQLVLAGLGVGYQINNAISVSLAGRLFLTGKETQNASVLAFGLTWSAL
jgi:hypothetical protein